MSAQGQSFLAAGAPSVLLGQPGWRDPSPSGARTGRNGFSIEVITKSKRKLSEFFYETDKKDQELAFSMKDGTLTIISLITALIGIVILLISYTFQTEFSTDYDEEHGVMKMQGLVEDVRESNTSYTITLLYPKTEKIRIFKDGDVSIGKGDIVVVEAEEYEDQLIATRIDRIS